MTFRTRGSVPDGVGEQSTAPGDTGSHRADRDVQDGCDALVVEIGDVTKDHGHAEVVGQFGQCPLHQFAVLESEQGSFGPRVGFWCSTGRFGRVETRLGSSASSSEFVEGGVGRDAICPRGERRPTVEGRKSADDGDERVLCRIVGIGAASEDTQTHGVQTSVVTSKEIVEGLRVAVAGSFDQFVIGHGAGETRISDTLPRYGLASLQPESRSTSRR